MNKCVSLIVLLSLFLSACAHVAGDKGPPDQLKKVLVTPTQDVYYDTQVVMADCPPGVEMAPLLAAVAAAAVSQGVSRIGDALKAAGNAETQTALSRRNVELDATKPLPGCVAVARGWFYRGLPDHPVENDNGVADQNTGWPFLPKEGSQFKSVKSDVADSFWRMGLNIATTPDFYFLGAIRSATDGSAYAIRPVEALLEEPIGKNSLRPSKKRSVLVAFAFSDAGSGVDLSKGGGATMVLGAMEPGRMITFPPGKTDCPSWKDKNEAYQNSGCPTNPDFFYLNRSAFESNWFTLKAPDKPSEKPTRKPINLQALVTETRSASKFLLFVGDVFGSTKESITEELRQALIPSFGEDADLADQAASDAKSTAFDNALSKAIVDLSACIAKPDDVTKRVAARIALRALMTTGRAKEVNVSSFKPDDIKNGDKTAHACKVEKDKVLAL